MLKEPTRAGSVANSQQEYSRDTQSEGDNGGSNKSYRA